MSFLPKSTMYGKEYLLLYCFGFPLVWVVFFWYQDLAVYPRLICSAPSLSVPAYGHLTPNATNKFLKHRSSARDVCQIFSYLTYAQGFLVLFAFILFLLKTESNPQPRVGFQELPDFSSTHLQSWQISNSKSQQYRNVARVSLGVAT